MELMDYIATTKAEREADKLILERLEHKIISLGWEKC